MKIKDLPYAYFIGIIFPIPLAIWTGINWLIGIATLLVLLLLFDVMNNQKVMRKFVKQNNEVKDK
jgi:hypothetical protein